MRNWLWLFAFLLLLLPAIVFAETNVDIADEVLPLRTQAEYGQRLADLFVQRSLAEQRGDLGAAADISLKILGAGIEQLLAQAARATGDERSTLLNGADAHIANFVSGRSEISARYPDLFDATADYQDWLLGVSAFLRDEGLSGLEGTTAPAGDASARSWPGDENLRNAEYVGPLPLEATEQVRLSKVVDGDTLEVQRHDGSLLRVRLLGIDAPELGDGTRESFDAALDLCDLTGDLEYLYIERDSGAGTDSFGRELAWVWGLYGDGGRSLLNLHMLWNCPWVDLYRNNKSSRYRDWLTDALRIRALPPDDAEAAMLKWWAQWEAQP